MILASKNLSHWVIRYQVYTHLKKLECLVYLNSDSKTFIFARFITQKMKHF